MLRTFVLHNNNAEKFMKNWLNGKNCWINNQVSAPFFNFKWIYLFFRIHMIFFSIFYVYKTIVLEKKKNTLYHATPRSITRKIVVCDVES